MGVITIQIAVNKIDRNTGQIEGLPRNPRFIRDEKFELLKKSIQENPEMLGLRELLVYPVGERYVIIGGNMRYEACKALGYTSIPCKVLDADTPVETLRAYTIKDNAGFGEWDWDAIANEWDAAEVADWGLDVPEWETEEEPQQEAKEDDFDDEKDKVETVCKKGDIWLLGQHRLMCGDSTLPEDVARLMDGEKADMTFTDPPYNIGYMGVKDKRSIKNDKMSNEDFVDFLTKSIMVTDTVYVCCSWQYAQLFREAMEKLGIAPKAMIVWNKVHAAQHLDKYYKQHEIIWYFGKFGGQKTLRGDIWEVPREPNTVHPTMKPIKLIAIALGDNPDKTIVYDGFGGSGSTLIACEQLGRKARIMELDPHYCDVIIARWEKLTGQKATKL